jgi:hypothetical protein
MDRFEYLCVIGVIVDNETGDSILCEKEEYGKDFVNLLNEGLMTKQEYSKQTGYWWY